MSFLSIPSLWAQGFLAGVPPQYQKIIGWLFVFGEPNYMIEPTTLSMSILSGLVTWMKVISLFCLLGWVASWIATALKERVVRKWSWLDFAALLALAGCVGTLALHTMETNERIKVYKIAGTNLYIVAALSILFGSILFLWVEAAIWSSIRRLGKTSDIVVLLGMHLALALGLGIGLVMQSAANSLLAKTTAEGTLAWWEGPIYGLRISGTYMGYIVLLKVVAQIFTEILAVRPRRLFSIASLSVVESNRRMWAPWAVITIFIVILAFTHWFLQPPRPAEMGRLFVSTLSLLCSLLITAMITFLTPLSLPHDIQNQTIYTVVSKPVRRIELIWGRMLGYMALVTALVLVFGAISLGYLWQNVNGQIRLTEQQAMKAGKEGRLAEFALLRDQADQLRNRMTARVPIYGALTFLDSRGTPHNTGIDVGSEQGREPRSHIEGGTPATAIWHFGIVPDPRVPPGTRAPLIDTRIPVDVFLKPGTVEYLHNHVYEVQNQITNAQREQAQPNLPASRSQQLTSTINRGQEELKNATAAYEKLKASADALQAKAVAAEQQRASDAEDLRRQVRALHSDPIMVEMTFNIYRTTKGVVGEAVYGQLEATNPVTGVKSPRDLFPVREYYTNKRTIPAELLAGSGGNLVIEVQCISQTQYLGMAQSDLFLLATEGDFGPNFMKGLFGVWLQAMVLTAIGVFAGTFLSWPVALLTTIAFFVAGQVAFAFLLDFTRQSLMGGGPFESMIRLVTHDNQMTDLNPTFAVITAKTLDALVMPVMSRLVYVVPNFSALDVSNDVANGFAVSWIRLVANSLLAIAYALPFSIAGYFILKNREVAA
jgi:ABC-type transport system involved in multi-copper enzyme maturation permease subunit